MIITIAKNQFVSNILTKRFITGFLVCEILFIFSAFILSQDFSARRDNYNNLVTKHRNQTTEIQTFARLQVGVDRPPAPLGVFVEGVEKKVGSTLFVGFDLAPRMAENSDQGNPLLSVFPQFDLVMIIQVILSLMVILFSYDSISGKRESGILKLALSNSISRHKFLLGDFIGGMLTIIFPLFAGLVSALLIFILSGTLTLTMQCFADILLIAAASVLYLSLFYILGMLISARTRQSSTVLTLLLFIWILTVFIIPNSAVYVGDMIIKVPDKSEIDNRISDLNSEWHASMRDYVKDHPRPEYERDFIRGRNVMQGDYPYAYALWYAPRETMEWVHYGSIFGHNLKMETENRIWLLITEYRDQLLAQARINQYVSALSPSWLFYDATSRIAGTSNSAYINFIDQVHQYRESLISYMKDKGGLSTELLYGRNKLDSYLTLDELKKIKETRGDQALEEIIGTRDAWSKAGFLDLDDLPRFSYSETDPARKIAGILPHFSLLIFLNILLFGLAWTFFLKADIR